MAAVRGLSTLALQVVVSHKVTLVTILVLPFQVRMDVYVSLTDLVTTL